MGAGRQYYDEVAAGSPDKTLSRSAKDAPRCHCTQLSQGKKT